MSWGGGVGSGNLLGASTDAVAFGFASLANLFTNSVVLASGYSVTTAANVGGSAAAIVGRPEFFLSLGFRGATYLVPIYRSV